MPKKKTDIEYYEAVGRRREAVARVRLYIVGKDKTVVLKLSKEGKDKSKIKAGAIYVNNRPIQERYVHSFEKAMYLKPLQLTDCQDRFVVSIVVSGGGKNGQLDAIIHGLSRALDQVDKIDFHKKLKTAGFLTRDARTRERRSVGTGGKARRQKQSPKR